MCAISNFSLILKMHPAAFSVPVRVHSANVLSISRALQIEQAQGIGVVFRSYKHLAEATDHRLTTKATTAKMVFVTVTQQTNFLTTTCM